MELKLVWNNWKSNHTWRKKKGNLFHIRTEALKWEKTRSSRSSASSRTCNSFQASHHQLPGRPDRLHFLPAFYSPPPPTGPVLLLWVLLSILPSLLIQWQVVIFYPFISQHSTARCHHQASTSERRRSCGEFLCISNFGTWGRCWFGWSWVLFIYTVGPLQPLRGQLLHSYSSLTAVSRESLMSSPTRLVPSLSAPSWCLFFLFFFSVGAEQAFLETEGQVVTSTCSTDSAH